jgi:hypothetical protein
MRTLTNICTKNYNVMNEKKENYTVPQCEVVEMETVTPFLDDFSSGSQSGSLRGYDNTNVDDDE